MLLALYTISIVIIFKLLFATLEVTRNNDLHDVPANTAVLFTISGKTLIFDGPSYLPTPTNGTVPFDKAMQPTFERS